MNQPVPLPVAPPFLSLYTPAFRRPQALARCLASVTAQTAAADLEQLVVPDHVGYGVERGLYGRLPWYALTLRGQYINVLCDDDVLAGERVVATVRDFAQKRDQPPVIVVRVEKNGQPFPRCAPTGPPVRGLVDLTSYIVRADVWRAHVGDYKVAYDGDADHAQALYNLYPFAFCDVLYAVGAASHGRPEA